MSAAIAVAVGGAAFVATAAVAFAGTGGARARLRQRARMLALRQKSGGSTRVPGKPAASLKKAEARSIPLFENLARRFLPRQSALRARLARTGYDLTIGTYLMICGGLVPIVFTAAALGIGLTAPPAALVALAAGLGLPHIGVGVAAAAIAAGFSRSFRMRSISWCAA